MHTLMDVSKVVFWVHHVVQGHFHMYIEEELMIESLTL